VWRDSREKKQGETAKRFNVERPCSETFLERQQGDREREENKLGN
jgi:hypothetical protein